MTPKPVLGLLVLAVATLGATAPPKPAIPLAGAAKVFARDKALCDADGGKLWGVSLCTPMMLADPTTRETVVNRRLPGSTPDGAYFRLTLPPSAQVANAPFTYHGIRIAQILYPVYGNAEMQDVTLMHESFHVVQPRLGFNGDADMGSIAGDDFLDTQAGRTWLRGELHALRTALKAHGDARSSALRDALAMRLYRHTLSAQTAKLERELDVLEGLAEGTGIDAGLPASRRIPYALHDIAFVEEQPSYARAFPYATGPAYTELLDAASPTWRRSVRPSSDIALMTMRAYHLNVATPTAAQAQQIIARYDGKAIEAQEAARAARKVAADARFTRELVQGPTLALPMRKFHITFNPRDIETLGNHGTVYHTLQVTAAWGSIVVANGDALIDKDFHTLRVAAPASTTGSAIKGNGWTLTLSPGYAIAPDPQSKGSYVVTESP